MVNKLSPWIFLEGDYCAVRTIEGADPHVIETRMAVIEKTPRVRIRPHYLGTQQQWDDAGNITRETRQWPEFLDWCSGDKGDGPTDQQSRAWCDAMLTAMGYQL